MWTDRAPETHRSTTKEILMRVLFATTAGEGHFGPMVPFARACAAAGHEVRVAAPGSFAGAVGRAGLDHLPVPDAPPEELGAVFGRLPSLPFLEANAAVMQEVFAGVDARSVLPALREAVRAWRPDLIVRESAEIASYVVAEQEGVAHVEIGIATADLDEFALPLLDEPVRALGAERGAEGLAAAPVLSVVPEALEDPAKLGRRAVHRFRYLAGGSDGATLPPPWGDPGAPLVYASFGTVAAAVGLFPVLYRAVIDAVADMPVRLLLTLGEAGDVEALGPLPANVHVERFWPQAHVMPHAAAVVGHGGFGTTMTGLAHGVPQVVLPLFAIDQHHNAAAVVRSGSGLAVDGFAPGAALPDPVVLAAGLPAALDAVLGDPALRDGARRVAGAMAALPDPAECVQLLVRLAEGGG
jgi:UDP:flavonoid glycosyltransferase YjiC (YdhE family)